MLHSATAKWTSSGDADLSHTMQFESGMAMGKDAIAVSSLGETAIVETPASTEVAAFTTQPSYPANSLSAETGLYTADTAVMALGLVGAWMMVVGGAMLARRSRLVKG
ncbi:MAG: hypothetical protein Q7J29_11640 [Stagnimonas sp.]|nr:hypothetical protein [Stagnimonas sp.]